MREIRQHRGDARQGFVREMRLLDGDRDEDLGWRLAHPLVIAPDLLELFHWIPSFCPPPTHAR